MEKDKITLKRDIDYFYANIEDSVDFLKFKIGSTITFPLTKSHIVRIENDVNFSFTFDKFDTKIFRLSKADFQYYGLENDILTELEKKFKLIRKIGLNKDYFSLYFQGKEGFETCLLAFQRKDSQFFMIAFSSKREQEASCMAEDFYGNNIYYIHGIWEVELSEEFQKKIYGKPFQNDPHWS